MLGFSLQSEGQNLVSDTNTLNVVTIDSGSRGDYYNPEDCARNEIWCSYLRMCLISWGSYCPECGTKPCKDQDGLCYNCSGQGCGICSTQDPSCPNCFYGCSQCLGFCHNCHDDACDGTQCGERVTYSPNPTSDVLTIEISIETSISRTLQNITYNVRLLNAQGVVMRQQQSTTGKVEFNVSNLPEGTYYLHIERNGEIRKEQITVKRK